MFQFEFEGALFRLQAKRPFAAPLLTLPPQRSKSPFAASVPIYFLILKLTNYTQGRGFSPAPLSKVMVRKGGPEVPRRDRGSAVQSTSEQTRRCAVRNAAAAKKHSRSAFAPRRIAEIRCITSSTYHVRQKGRQLMSVYVLDIAATCTRTGQSSINIAVASTIVSTHC